MKKIFLGFFLSITWSLLFAYPVDISYMVSDFKYSQEHGIKICEVQQGALSAFNGDLYISGGNGSIATAIAEFFERFPMKKWAAGLTYRPLKNSLAAKGWEIQPSIKALESDPAFLDCAVLPPPDPYSIASYAGVVYATYDMARNFDLNYNTYPGVVFMDAAVLPYWIDKYKMNLLFNEHPELKKYKADWELYPKKYDPGLAQRIQEKMPSELYVIKPRGEFLGSGVIVVAREDLDDVLQMILEPKASLKHHADESYSYWWSNRDETFLIEKHYSSDCLCFSHKLSEQGDAVALENGGEYHYDATMRLVFILEYDKGNMSYHCMGGFWKLPCKALEEEGSLNDKRISFGAPPFYRAIEPALFEEASAQMEQAMLLLYEIMLNRF